MATRLVRSRKRTPLSADDGPMLPTLPDDTIHLSGHKGIVSRIVPLPDGERVVTASYDKTLRLFSVRSGKCLNTFEGHTGAVVDVALLSDDTMVSVSYDKTARLWHVSDATLIHTVTFENAVCSVASLGAGRFVAGLYSGDLCEVQSSGNTAPILVKTVRSANGSHSNAIYDISVCGGRFATASFDETAKVWDSTLQCLATFDGHSNGVYSVALSDTFVATGSRDNIIRVYDANTFEFLRNITTHSDSVLSVRLAGHENIVSSSLDGTVAIHNTSTGEPIWRIDVGSSAWDSIILSTGHIATACSSGKAVVYNPPANIVSLISQSSNVGLPFSTALQVALSTCLSGDSSALDHCNNLITYSACSASLEEWHSAHQILILAVKNKDIPQSTEYNGETSWWFKELYLAIKDINIPSDEDLTAVQRCLHEAKDLGLIEGTESVLAALHVTKAFEQEIRALHRAGIFIFQRVLQLEERVDRFVKLFDRYRKQQLYSQLVGIALQLIPIAGGAAAGALTAGAEIVEGLSIKDVVDYAFGLGSNLAQEAVSSFGDRALRRAVDVLSPEKLREMDVIRQRRLEQAVEGCGLRVEELRAMFLEKVKGEEGVGSSEEVEVTEVTIEENSLDVTDCGIDAGAASSTEPNTGEAAEVEVLPYDLTAQAAGCDLLLSWESCKPSDLKKIAIERETIKPLEQVQLATVWAGFAVRHDDTRLGEFRYLGECLYAALVANDMFGDDLVGEAEGPRIDFVSELVLGSVRNDERITLKFGLESRIRRFVSELGARS